MELTEVESKTSNTWYRVGSFMTSLIGILPGMVVVIVASFMQWTNDNVLGVYGKTGMEYNNLVNGDGKITLVAASITLFCLLAGAVLIDRISYAIALALSVSLFLFAIYEMVYVPTSSPILGAGTASYLVAVGSFLSIFGSGGGYLMAKEKRLQKPGTSG